MDTRRVVFVVFMGVLVVGLVILLVGAALTSYFNQKVTEAGEEKLSLIPGTDAYKYWLNGSGNTYYERYYVFNVTNPKEAAEGREKPNLREIGPYTYRVELSRVNVSLTDGDTQLSSVEIKKRYFVENVSVGDEVKDLVTTANIPIIALASMLRYSDQKIQRDINKEFINVSKQELFVQLPIKELLWGYENPGLVQALIVLGMIYDLHPINNTIFGLQYQDGEPTGVGLDGYSIHTGLDDINRIHQINTWNDQRTLTYWKSEYSNKVIGTGARSWTPGLKSTQQLNAFHPEWCRSIYYNFVNKTTSANDDDDMLMYLRDSSLAASGGERWRYVMPHEVLDKNDKNSGFCTPTTQQCMDSGVLNVTVCKDNYPLYLSQPHFYSASDVYTRNVSGLSPRDKRHQTQLSIHPKTGYVTSSKLKIQYNVELKTSKAFSALDNFKESLILPVAWKETIFMMNSKDLERLEKNIDDVTVLCQRYKRDHYLLLGLGGFFTLIALIVIIVLLVTRKSAGYNVAAAAENNAREEDDERRSLLHDT